MDSSQISRSSTDIIVSLLNVPFAQRDDDEKVKIVKSGRPLPELHLPQRYKHHMRTFQMSWYHQHKWLCGSEEKEKLYCWPCLLMSTKKSPWTSDGYNDIKNISRSSARHNASRDHLSAFLSLIRLSKRVLESSDKVLQCNRLENIKHNELVKMNREVLKLMIDVTSLICKVGPLFKRLDKSKPEGSFDSGNFNAIFDLVLKRNSEVKQHWEKAEGFRDLTKNVHNELVECFHGELQKAIESEIKQAAFFSCMVEGTGHVVAGNNKEFSVVLRLVDTNGTVREYFFGFYEVEGHKTAQQLITVLCKVLNQFNIRHKLVALTYDGCCVVSRELNYFQTKIKEIVPQVTFPHNFHHSINLILQQSCSSIKPVKEFFATVQGIPNFFHGSTKRTAVLSRVLTQGFPTADEAAWSASFKVISAVHTNRLALVEVFRQLLDLSSDAETIRQSHFYINRLKEFMFVFLLSLFNNIFEKTDSLRTTLNRISKATKLCSDALIDCISFVRHLRNNLSCEELIQATVTRAASDQHEHTPDASSYYKQVYFEVLDNIITQLEFKSSSCKKLSFLRLGNLNKFPIYNNEFPDEPFTSLLAVYSSHFNQERLRTELETIFSSEHRDDVQNLSLRQLVERMVKDDIADILPEAFRLFSLLLTIPASFCGSPCLPRIKAYVKNNATRSDVPALVHIELDTLGRLEQVPGWHDDVITRFAQKQRPVELLYRPSSNPVVVRHRPTFALCTRPSTMTSSHASHRSSVR